MNIRLVKANESDYPKLQKYIKNTSYHWIVTSIPLPKRIERINCVCFPQKPRFCRDRRIVTATEKYANYSEKDYLKRLELIKHEKGELFIVYDDDKVIGFVYWRNECGRKRIMEFPLEFDYQEVCAIKEVVNKLSKKIKNNRKMYVIYAGECGRDILAEIPEIHIGFAKAV